MSGTDTGGAVARWFKALASEALGGWRESAAQQIHSRGLLRSAAQRILHRDLDRAWRRWAWAASEQKRLGALGSKARGRWQQQLASKALGRWAHSAARLAEERKVLRRAVMRITRLCLVQAVHGWADAAKSAVRRRDVSAQVARRWAALLSAGALAHWHQQAQQQLRERGVLGKVVARMRNARVQTAMERWMEVAEGRRWPLIVLCMRGVHCALLTEAVSGPGACAAQRPRCSRSRLPAGCCAMSGTDAGVRSCQRWTSSTLWVAMQQVCTAPPFTLALVLIMVAAPPFMVALLT
eukprot:3358421-Rhodomonas_salina.3